MKTQNFPARKLKRQMDANRDNSKPYSDEELAKLATAREIKTKKYRGAP